MKKEIKIELTEKELAEILAKHFGVSKESATVDVYRYNADSSDPREQSYTKITFLAPINNLKNNE